MKLKRNIAIDVPQDLFAGALRAENLVQGYYGDVIEVEEADGTPSVLILLPYVALADLDFPEEDGS